MALLCNYIKKNYYFEMKTTNHRSFSEREIKLPKIPLNAKIGPRTRLSPPSNFQIALELPPKSDISITEASNDLLHAPSVDFLDQLIQKYTSTTMDGIDFTKKIQKPRTLVVSWNIKTTYGHNPPSRVGGAMTAINNEIYLFGGQCGDRINELKLLKYETLHWETVNTVKSMETPEPRDGHTLLNYKHYLVVYGGAGGFNSTLHTRTCSPLLHLFDTQALQWKIHKPLGILPDPRRNHGAALIGNTMLIYGGIGNDHNTLSDFQGLNLENMQWMSLKFSKDSIKPGKRHSFTITSVYHPAIFKQFNNEIFNLPPIYDDEFTRKNCGMYIFGGMNDSGNVLNDLYLLQHVKKNTKTDKNILKIIKVDSTGRPPISRYCHSMALCGKLLVIVGGRNDSLFVGSNQSSVNEIAAINITVWRWEIIDVVGMIPNSCWGLASVSMGTRLICFGGMNLNSFSSNELWVMETNQDLIDGFETKKRENPIRIIIKRNTRFF